MPVFISIDRVLSSGMFIVGAHLKEFKVQFSVTVSKSNPDLVVLEKLDGSYKTVGNPRLYLINDTDRVSGINFFKMTYLSDLPLDM